MSLSTRRLLLLGVTLCLALIPATSQAGYNWSFGDQRYWGIDDTQFCRDGAVILAFHQESTVPDGEIEPFPLNVVARLHNDAAIPPPDESGLSDYPFETYGPLVSPSYSFTLTYQSEPWPPSITDQPGDIYMYTSGVLRWYHPLEAGTHVVLHSSFSGTMIEGQVQECDLNPTQLLSVTQAGSETITSAFLNAGHGMPADGEAFFRIDSLPAHGSLLLGDSPLELGDLFTQADIQAGRLSYLHDGSESSDDSFAFHIERTLRVSVNNSGDEGNNVSISPALSSDGAHIVFASHATNLVDDDSNEVSDIFTHDLTSRQTVRVSVTGDGAEANNISGAPHISSGFGYPIVFESYAANLVSSSCLLFDEQNGSNDIVLRSSTLQQISATPVRFGKCYQANQDSSAPVIGAFEPAVAFVSHATNLLLSVDNDDNVLGREDDNGVQDVYLWLDSGGVVIVSVPNGESGSNPVVLGNGRSFAPAIAADGRTVTFQSNANNLVDNDNNGASDIFVRRLNETERVSIHSDGTESEAAALAPAISGNGRFVAFESSATNLVTPAANGNRHIFVHDRDSHKTTQVSLASGGEQANNHSFFAAISYNGRFVAFSSLAGNLVANDTNGVADIFVRDRDTDSDGIFDEPGQVQTTRVSVAIDGSEGNGAVQGTPTISSDGQVVAFTSAASNLVTGDGNESRDIFVHYTGVPNLFRLEITPPTIRLPAVAK